MATLIGIDLIDELGVGNLGFIGFFFDQFLLKFLSKNDKNETGCQKVPKNGPPFRSSCRHEVVALAKKKQKLIFFIY